MSAIEDYVKARANVENCLKELRQAAEVYEKYASAVRQRPERLAFINLENRTIQLSSSAFGGVEIDATVFKTAEQLQTILAEFHKHYQPHVDLYLAMPVEFRSGVLPPLAREFEKIGAFNVS